MTDVLIEAGTLQASADTREISGVLVPFGVQGNTNLGRFTVEAGAFTLPKDPSVVTLNVQHDHESPVGRATLLAEKNDGIHATFRFADTEDGDQALSDFRSGTRTNLSVEAKGIVLRAGKALAGRIFGAAVVQAGAFPGATLLAADAGELPEDVEPITPDEQDAVTTEETSVDEAGNAVKTVTTKKTETGADGTVTETTTTTTVAVTTPEQPEENPTEEGADMPNAVVPGTLAAAAPAEKKGLSKNQAFALMAAKASGTLRDQTLLAALNESMTPEHSLFAALNDVKYDAAGGLTTNIALPTWLGEIWDGQEYRQKFLPLFTHADLSSLKFRGYKWGVKPEGGSWAGNKSEVPSNAPSLVPVEGTAERFAGAHDIAREFQDLRAFGDFSFFESYYRAMAESYARWVDEEIVLEEVLNGATAVEADNPAGLSIGAGLSAIIDGASEVISANATPSFALVETSLWKSIAKIPSDSTLGYLNASLRLTGEEGQLDSFVIQPTDKLAAGQVLVGAREAVTVFELPGAPVRVDALDVAHGGIDAGLYGYAGAMVNKSDALQLVSAYTA
ncbi:hypothetical protein DEJ17_09730 [Curtobacterium sp. MCSS17_011]|uniref:hypothetical protein n=1 Tax=Curtobacterium sp. MCSS17_011 TaxID=2175643 RepID=UPI000D84C1FA|nr:hypothetical protein [Curtobacterium sp. MCSS17_011]PYY57770.1 hypothetical protein DEJ17_09730 [Curtobacterium sp. MCSS17_011]